MLYTVVRHKLTLARCPEAGASALAHGITAHASSQE